MATTDEHNQPSSSPSTDDQNKSPKQSNSIEDAPENPLQVFHQRSASHQEASSQQDVTNPLQNFHSLPAKLDHKRPKRNRPGTKNADLYNWKTMLYKDNDSCFAAYETIFQRIQSNPTAVKKIIRCPDEQDQDIWITEQVRMLLKETNAFIVHLAKVCNKDTQPEMKLQYKGEELLFYCSAFDPPILVSAIDYMVNTLAHSTSILCDPVLFPTRNSVTKKGLREIKTMMRRLYRIYAFAYYIYRKEFEEFEDKYAVCERFTRLCKEYSLMSSKSFMIPSSYWKERARKAT